MNDDDRALSTWQGLQAGRQVDLDDLLRRVIDDVVRLLDADRGTLYLFDHARSELVSRVAHLPELAEIRLKLGEGVAGLVARTGVRVNVPGAKGHPKFSRRIDRLTGYETRSVLCAPVRGDGGSTLAVLQVLNARRGRFDDADEVRIDALSAEVALLLQTTSLRSQLHPGQRHALGFRFNHIVGESPAMRVVYDLTARAARTEATVIVVGETGSGKEAIARAVHYNSPRHEGPFVKVDCAALPANLIENELFGHERGAFTGADRASEGKVNDAHGGTLFLDEVGELPLEVQGKLLRLLQDRVFVRVGGTRAVNVDARFVCATHRDLGADVKAGRFRADLYYRLHVVPIAVPPLRERGAADLDRLIDHFIFELSRRHQRAEVHLDNEGRSRLHAHAWPGNVRELEHCIEAAIVLSATPRLEIRLGESQKPLLPSAATPVSGGPPFSTPIRPLMEVERAYVDFVLHQCEGNRSEAARVLGIGRNTLSRKLVGSPT